MIDGAGRILVAGAAYAHVPGELGTRTVGGMTIWRFEPDGEPDASFGENGRAVRPWTEPRTTRGDSIQIDSKGRIVVCGSIEGRGPAVWRHLPDGTPDDSFGENGYVAPETYLPTTGHSGNGMAIDTSGRIVIAGNRRGREFDVFVVRLNPDGSLDRSFGRDGFVCYDRHTGFGCGGL